jgi:serine/threonine protein kinase/Tfp pilus assembly protein PilF
VGCPDENVLLRFLEQQPGPDETSMVRLHTEACPECRRVLAELTRMRSSGAGNSTAPSAGACVDEIPVGTPLGRYVLLARAGSGSMGVVYAAYDPGLDRKVAIKLLRVDDSSEEATARLKREGQVLARLHHPNVITVHDIGSWQSRTFIAMEFVAGGTVRQWLRESPRTLSQVLRLYLSAGHGLAAAHAQGQVHRDFKPDNVLVDADGRVVVTDFGLATAPNVNPTLDTREGSLLGTPAYMSPEQLRGEPASAQSDQFSFCVSAWEGICGERPFRGENVRALLEAITAGKLSAASSRVPSRARRALLRGLSSQPEARFPDMNALLRALSPSSRRRWVLAAAVVGALSLTALAVTLQRTSVCADSQERLMGAWDPLRRAQVHEAFLKTQAPFAEASFEAAARELDAWASQFVTTRREACRATRVAGSQSEELLDLRMWCFDDRLKEVRALTEVYAHADAATVLEAHRALSQLTPLSECGDERALRAPERPPADAATRAHVSRLREALSEASALEAAAQYARASQKLLPITREAAAVGYRPLEAEGWVALAEVQNSLEDYKAAESSFARAVLTSEAGGHLRAGARAWSGLAFLQRKTLAQLPAARESLAHAHALLERLSPDPLAEAAWLINAAGVDEAENKSDEAIAKYQQALVALEKLEPNGVRTATAYNSMGRVLRSQDKLNEALDCYQRALRILEARLGPLHPHVALAVKNVGNFHWSRGEWDLALRQYQRALDIQLKAFGPDSVEVAFTQNNVAAVYLQLGKFEQARVEFSRALATREKALGPDHPSLGPMLNNLGVVYGAQKKRDEALVVLRRALAIAEKAHGPVHSEVETALVNLGEALTNSGDFKAAAEACARAAAIAEKIDGPNHPNLAEDLAGQGTALLAMGDAPGALRVLTRAMEILASAQTRLASQGVIRFTRAKALWAARVNERATAVAEARLGLTETEQAGNRMKPQAEEISQWLKMHPR